MEQKNVMSNEKEMKEIEAIKKNKAILSYLDMLGIKPITAEELKGIKANIVAREKPTCPPSPEPEPMEFIRDVPMEHLKNIGVTVNNSDMANLIVSLIRAKVFNIKMTDKMKNLDIPFFNNNGVSLGYVFVFDFRERRLKAYNINNGTRTSEIEETLNIDLLPYSDFILTVTSSKNILKSKKHEENVKKIEEKKQKIQREIEKIEEKKQRVITLQKEVEKLERLR